MSLHPEDPTSPPEETRRVARAAFPKGTLCLDIADALGAIYQDSQFAALFAQVGQPAAAPAMLALATVLQYMEGLSDRQAADAVRRRVARMHKFATKEIQLKQYVSLRVFLRRNLV